ncbi:MAG: acyltransferase [Sediminibacterium sp.]|nr:MAG: acyltransferase [Sediminibacterium sp.] [Sediminibacterium sp. FEMGT703S]
MIKKIVYNFPILKHIYRTKGTAAPITLRCWFIQKILGFNKDAYWPTHHSSMISGVKNIKIGIGTAPGLSPGCYIQGGGKIFIGDYTIVAPNVGIISANHSLYDYTKHESKEVYIGRYCWIGMNSVIMPGVVLGDHTIVAAGAIVTKKFEEGYCVLAGNPAKIIKLIDKKMCVEKTNIYQYRGYIYCGE